MTVVTAAQIAEEAEVHRTTVYGWIRRYEDFPRPQKERIAGAEVWDLHEVQRWLLETEDVRRPGHPAKQATSRLPPRSAR